MTIHWSPRRRVRGRRQPCLDVPAAEASLSASRRLLQATTARKAGQPRALSPARGARPPSARGQIGAVELPEDRRSVGPQANQHYGRGRADATPIVVAAAGRRRGPTSCRRLAGRRRTRPPPAAGARRRRRERAASPAATRRGPAVADGVCCGWSTCAGPEQRWG
jgi:hypothetical protein